MAADLLSAEEARLPPCDMVEEGVEAMLLVACQKLPAVVADVPVVPYRTGQETNDTCLFLFRRSPASLQYASDDLQGQVSHLIVPIDVLFSGSFRHGDDNILPTNAKNGDEERSSCAQAEEIVVSKLSDVEPINSSSLLSTREDGDDILCGGRCRADD